jgi:hypothetical protein
MKSTITFTTTLSPKIMEFLRQESQKEQITIREIIEKAIKKYQTEKTKAELAEAYKEIADNPEIKEFAEMGISDYNEMINQLEK